MRASTLLVLAAGLSGGVLLGGCAASSALGPTATASPVPVAPSSTPIVGCLAVTAEPTPVGSAQLTTISTADYVRGPDTADVTLLYYCDFQSAQCELFNRVLDQLVTDHPGDLRVVMRPFAVPVSVVPSLDKSELAAWAALAAGQQGMFWKMRDLLDDKYEEWTQLAPDKFKIWLGDQASGLGLDVKQFASDLSGSATAARARDIYDSATKSGISGIPTVFINGRLQQRAALSREGLQSTIALLALGQRQFKSCPPFAVDSTRQYTAMLHTSKGDIAIELFAAQAPLAVNSFVFLARQHWFDGVTFHRVIPGFVAQTGDPSGTGRGGPGYIFDNEIQSDLQFDKPGVVGMANSGPDTNGSQFFITYSPQPQLDGGYTVFGQVTAGMDVVNDLTPRDPQSGGDLPPGDQIISITIEEH
jgi:cyclophilin family peptidyl-prolyl cis-trans isomerase/protein-disulfide isomerase